MIAKIPRHAPLLAIAPLALALWLAAAYWPGLPTWDTLRQYDQAVSGRFDDWHPPVMEWIWRQLLPLSHSPAPMLIIQLALFFAGFALLIAWALKQRRPGVAMLFGLMTLLPIPLALMATVVKDSLMTGALVAAAAGLFWPGRATRIIAIALLLFVATLRFNAFLACWPLLMAVLPGGWIAGPRRFICTGLIALALLLSAMPLANRAIGAEKSGVELSLIIFDLGGIGYYSGKDAFPAVGPMPDNADPVAVNRKCYSPVKWDPYSWWVDSPCPIGFERVKAWFRVHHVDPYRWWLTQIAHHPFAYATHRLAHWNINARFIVPDEVERPVQVSAAPNDVGFRVPPSLRLTLVDGAALLSAHSPLGWPAAWMALALGTLIAGRRLRSRRFIVPLAASALLYGLGYAALSVASELRYYLWTMVATAIAATIVGTEIGGTRRIASWLGPVFAVSAVCALSRGFGW